MSSLLCTSISQVIIMSHTPIQMIWPADYKCFSIEAQIKVKHTYVAKCTFLTHQTTLSLIQETLLHRPWLGKTKRAHVLSGHRCSWNVWRLPACSRSADATLLWWRKSNLLRNEKWEKLICINGLARLGAQLSFFKN